MKPNKQAALPIAIRDAALAMVHSLPRCCSLPGFTYMVEAAGLIKIGRTMGGFSGLDLAKRLIDLQHMSPVRIALVAIGRGVRSERLLHTEFMDSRRHGEWFTASAVRRWISLHHGNSCLTCTLLGSGHDA